MSHHAVPPGFYQAIEAGISKTTQIRDTSNHVYLDDMLVMAQTRSELQNNLLWITMFLESLGCDQSRRVPVESIPNNPVSGLHDLLC